MAAASPRSILVVKLADLGDVLTATPAIRYLRQTFPEARLDALLTPLGARVLEGWDALDDVVVFEKAAFDRVAAAPAGLPEAVGLARRLRGRYDAVVLLHHLTTVWGTAKYAALALGSGAPIRAGLDNGRGWFLTHRAPDQGFGARHEVEYWLSVAASFEFRVPSPEVGETPQAERGTRNSKLRIEVPNAPRWESWADQRWRDLGLEGLGVAMVHPGSGDFSVARRWPAERFGQVAARLLSEHAIDRVLVLAGPASGEAALAAPVAQGCGGTVVGDVPHPQALAALLRRCALLVANDSGVTHLASAVETPTVAVFGPSNDKAWGPYPAAPGLAAVVREHLACSPCIYVGHSLGTPRGCLARTCLDLVEPDAVLAAVEGLGLRRPAGG